MNEPINIQYLLLNRDVENRMNRQGDWVILEITYGLHLGGVELQVLNVVGELVERLALMLHVL
jgi:hypothetical protein